jgi:PKD repeat protein
MNKTSQIKTHFDIKIIVFFIIIFTFSCLLLLYKKKVQSDCDVTSFKIQANAYKVGELVTFSDVAKGSYEWKWNFGDGSKVSYLSKVSHVFEKEGNYTVSLLIDNNCAVEKMITILPYEDKIDDSLLPKFQAPDVVMLGNSVNFRDLSNDAKSWEWRFGDGEGFGVDATDKNPSYVYKTAGRKVVSLVINGDFKHVKKKEIFVKEPVSKRDDVAHDMQNRTLPKIVAPEIGGLTEDKLEAMLYGIASNQMSYRNFSRHFCKSRMPEVQLKDGKVLSLKELDEEIREKSIKIKKVSMEKDKDGCVTSIVLSYKPKFFE